MKKALFTIIFVFLAAIGLTAGYFYATNKNLPQEVHIAQQRVTRTQKTQAPALQKTVNSEIGIPQKIKISKLGVNAVVEQVGKDSAGRMAIPKKWNNAGWYMYGPRPGEIGNAAIDGHVDTPQGKPSIFAGLKNLKTGDLITVVDDTGKELQFSVTKVETVRLTQFPLNQVFGPTNKKRLNLITCDGTWDKVKKDYSHRTIVYSELVE